MSEEASTHGRLFGFSVCILAFLSLFLFPVFAQAHETLGSSACEKCHKDQNAWWPKNNHYTTAEPFFDQKGKNVKIARLYGINPADMTKGNLLCMHCHGTIVSGSEKDAVTDGVGCEACHGPAKDYLKPHQEGEKSLGDARPGHVKGLEMGMVNVRDLKTRAKACGRCHNISEARLISAGHPSASNFFDYFVDGMTKTRHWTRPLDSTDALGNAHHEAFPEKGIALVEQVAPAGHVAPAEPKESPPAGRVSTVPAVGVPTAPTPLPERIKPTVSLPKPLPPPPPPVPRPIPPVAIQSSLPAESPPDVPLPPLPKIDKSTSVEEILLIVKERLDLLHHAVHKEP